MKMVDYILRKHAKHILGENDYKNTVKDISKVLKTMEYQRDNDVVDFMDEIKDILQKQHVANNTSAIAEIVTFFAGMFLFATCGTLPANTDIFSCLYDLLSSTMVTSFVVSGLGHIYDYLSKLLIADKVENFFLTTNQTSDETKNNVGKHIMAICDAVAKYDNEIKNKQPQTYKEMLDSLFENDNENENI